MKGSCRAVAPRDVFLVRRITFRDGRTKLFSRVRTFFVATLNDSDSAQTSFSCPCFEPRSRLCRPSAFFLISVHWRFIKGLCEVNLELLVFFIFSAYCFCLSEFQIARPAFGFTFSSTDPARTDHAGRFLFCFPTPRGRRGVRLNQFAPFNVFGG